MISVKTDTSEFSDTVVGSGCERDISHAGTATFFHIWAENVRRAGLVRGIRLPSRSYLSNLRSLRSFKLSR